jgi:hypothetical protein
MITRTIAPETPKIQTKRLGLRPGSATAGSPAHPGDSPPNPGGVPVGHRPSAPSSSGAGGCWSPSQEQSCSQGNRSSVMAKRVREPNMASGVRCLGSLTTARRPPPRHARMGAHSPLHAITATCGPPASSLHAPSPAPTNRTSFSPRHHSVAITRGFMPRLRDPREEPPSGGHGSAPPRARLACPGLSSATRHVPSRYAVSRGNDR